MTNAWVLQPMLLVPCGEMVVENSDSLTAWSLQCQRLQFVRQTQCGGVASTAIGSAGDSSSLRTILGSRFSAPCCGDAGSSGVGVCSSV